MGGVAVSVPEPGLTVCGRSFSPQDIACIREIISEEPPPCRREIARRTCEALTWLRPNGQLKEMSCRVALLRLQAKGLIDLPLPRGCNGNSKPYREQKTLVQPQTCLVTPVEQLARLRLRQVESPQDSRLWNEAVNRFHYLGYKRLPGAQLRYLITAEVGLLGVIGFGASAWKVAPRDRWIGWTQTQRKDRLHLIVNNARFLLLPWVRSKNLASKILSRVVRLLPGDFQRRYGYQPVLLETFVEKDRFPGTCYKAANWKYLGDTKGRGKLDRQRKYTQPVKQVYVYPLRQGFRRILCG